MFSLRLDGDLTATLHERRHASELYALVDANREHLDVWIPWPAETHAPEDLHAFIDGSLALFAKGEGWHGGLRKDGHLIGGISVHNVNRKIGRAEIGYWLAATEMGSGTMTRAVRGLLRHLFDDEGFTKIEIRAATGNRPSRAIPERIGFREEGVLRHVDLLRGTPIDHAVYGLLASEWKAAHDEEAHP